VSDAPAAAGAQLGPALAGRVILICGASGGLGSAAARACAAAGATVVLLGRDPRALGRVHDAIVESGGEALIAPFDLEGASPDDHAQLAARIDTDLGRLDGLLHCAADFCGLVPLQQTDPGTFARALHVGVTARWWLTQACLPVLRRAGDAAVVFVFDDTARTSRAFWGGYGIAQSANAALVSMLAAELRNDPVRVSGLQPPLMRTPLRQRAYVAEVAAAACGPDQVAAACVELLGAAGAAGAGPSAHSIQ